MPTFKSNINSKLPTAGVTIFTVMSKLAQEENALNLSQGFPDFNCSDELIALVNKYMKGSNNQYAPMGGVVRLREAISKKTEALYSCYYNPDTEITVTAGATQAIYTAITAVVREEDEVIIFEPAYDCYLPAIELCGAQPVFIPLKYPDYSVDWNFVKKMINHKTKMIIINTPHNPTGTILSAADMSKLEKLVKGTDIVVLSDEVYEHIIFDGYEHQSAARYPGLAERSFIISSFGKTYHTTGWKIGYCLAPRELMTEFRKAHQYQVFSANTPIQLAYADYLEKTEAYLELGNFYQVKRDLFAKLLKDTRFKFKPSVGTYFQLLEYKDISTEKEKDYAVRLTKEFKIASIPVSVFYHTPVDNFVLRFCFAKGNDTLEAAADILRRV